MFNGLKSDKNQKIRCCEPKFFRKHCWSEILNANFPLPPKGWIVKCLVTANTDSFVVKNSIWGKMKRSALTEMI